MFFNSTTKVQTFRKTKKSEPRFLQDLQNYQDVIAGLTRNLQSSNRTKIKVQTFFLNSRDAIARQRGGKRMGL